MKERLDSILESRLSKTQKKDQENEEKAIRSALKKQATLINEHFRTRAPLILKGCKASNETYKNFRNLLSFELEQKRAIVPRCNLPEIAKPFRKPLYVLEC